MIASKGIKSTEFWLAIATLVTLVLNGTSFVNIPWDQFTIWMTFAGVYTGARTVEKTVAHKNGNVLPLTRTAAPPPSPPPPERAAA